jgi:glycosyltransferase involved in cell wall biosynthesis
MEKRRGDHCGGICEFAEERFVTKPLVSILIPSYNAEKWIAETLQSALAQTWPRKEIIVVDDGSKDRTLEMARRFQSQGVLAVGEENRGAAAARNKAFSLSHGEYIQWLDADDLLSPDKIELQMKEVERLNDSGRLLSCGWGRFMYEPERARFVSSPLWCDLSPAEWLLRKMEHMTFMASHTWLLSRGVAEKAGPWDETLFKDNDGEYACRILLASTGVRFVPGAKSYYRDAGVGSVSDVGGSQRKLNSQWRSMELHIRYLRSLDDSPRARAACVRYLQDWLIYFYPDRMDIVEKAGTLCRELGGELQPPILLRRYGWMTPLFGYKSAMYVQDSMAQARRSLQRIWDWAHFKIHASRLAPRQPQQQ